MRSWQFPLALSSDPHLPLFLRIADSVVRDIQRGRLRPGDRLPGSRRLAASLGVHRNTVLAAYDELHAEGWVTAVRGRGTFVARMPPDNALERATKAPLSRIPEQVGFHLDAPIASSHLPRLPRSLVLRCDGTADPRLIPVAMLSRAYRRVLRLQGRTVLNYTRDAQGLPRLRVALASLLAATRGIAAPADAILVARGTQMGVSLIARTLIAPGEVVAVEDPGYPPAWDALRMAGSRLVPVPVDDGGLRVDALADIAAHTRIRAVYVTPHRQFPTTVTLGQERRQALLEMAQAARIAVIEDDYDSEFHYEGSPIAPLASADRAGVVIYVSSLSKVLAPGLRLGYVIGPPEFIRAVAAYRTCLDFQGDQPLEAAVAELLEEGEIQRHVRRVRRLYMVRRDAMAEALRAELGGAVSFNTPSGGMALWTRVAPGIDVDLWWRRAVDRRVSFVAGWRFAFERRTASGCARIGFAQFNEREIRDAVQRLARALPRASDSGR